MVSTVTRLQANRVHSYKVALGFIEAVDKSKWKLEQLLRFPALDKHVFYSGADPGFLERGFVFIKVWGVCFADLSQFSQMSHDNEIIWSH